MTRTGIWSLGALALALLAFVCIRQHAPTQTVLTNTPVASVVQPTTTPAASVPVPAAPPIMVAPQTSTAPALTSPSAVAPSPVAPAVVGSANEAGTSVAPKVAKAKQLPVIKYGASKKYTSKKYVAKKKALKRKALKKKRVYKRVATKRVLAANRCGNGLSTAVLQSICFVTNSATLSEESKRKLTAASVKIKANAQKRIEVAGFTDGSGSPQINAKLSEQRSQAVVEFLVKQGVDQAVLTSKGYGAESGERAQKHRRVDLKVMQP